MADLLIFGEVDLLRFGVVNLEVGVVALEFGVVGLLERDPARKSGNRWGETVRFSATISDIDMKEKN